MTIRDRVVPFMRCATCSRPLKQIEHWQGEVFAGVTFEHALVADHVPDPVLNSDVADQVSVCDFCTGPSPTMEFPAGQVAIEGWAQTHISDDNWYACDHCAAAVVADDYEAVIERWFALHLERGHVGPGDASLVAPRIRRWFASFKASRTGDPFRIGERR